MKRQISIGLMIFVMLVVTPSLALGAQFNEAGLLSSAFTPSVASAPWFISEVDTLGDTGQHTSVVIDPSSGWTFVSYYDTTNQDLRLGYFGESFAGICGPNDSWGCWTIDSGADFGKYSSIAINPLTGGVGIAYHDATNGKLKYVYFPHPELNSYLKQTIDIGIYPISSTGLYTSLKFNDYGKPFIAYHFDNPTGVDALMLSYYSVTGGNCPHPDSADSWRCETIITGEGVGQYASLALDEDGEQHIAYYDGANGDL